MNILERQPIVQLDEILTIRPTGKAKEDVFVNYHGLIIFIKNVPSAIKKDLTGLVFTVKVTSIKEKYAFAYYQGVSYDEN